MIGLLYLSLFNELTGDVQ